MKLEMRQVNQISYWLVFASLLVCLWFASQSVGQTVPTTRSASTTDKAQQQASPSPSPSPNPTPTTLDLTEVATTADELERTLQDVKRRLTNDADRVRVGQEVDTLGIELETRAEQTDEVLLSLPSL